MLYVLHVLREKELDVKKSLERNNVKAYVPRENRLVRCAGKWKKREYNLFSGYVFVESCDIKDDYYKLMVPSVISILGEPTALSGTDESWIRLLINDDNLIEPSIAVINEDGSITIKEGIVKNLPIAKIDKHGKRARLKINFADVAKVINLSLEFLNEV